MSLKDFARFPDPTLITTCEQNGQLIHLDYLQNQEFRNHMLTDLPDLSFEANPNLNLSFSADGRKSIFVKKRSEGFYGNLLSIWSESGYRGVINHLTTIGAEDSEGRRQLTLWKFLKWINDAADYLSGRLPFDKIKPSLSQADGFVRCLQPNNWRCSPVRAMAWHPDCTKLAVAIQNDYVKVFGLTSQISTHQIPSRRDNLLWTLRHAEQKNVTSLAWKPFSLSILAVGCEKTVILWHLESASLSTKPGPICAQILEISLCPIVWLSWDPEGSCLAVCSPTTSRITIYDLMTDSYSSVGSSLSCMGVIRALFSPNGSKLCLCYTGGSLRVYDTDTWLYQSWSNLEGPSYALTWTADSLSLIFSPIQSRSLFCIKFAGTSVELAEQRFGPGSSKNPNIVIGGSQQPILLFNLGTITTADGQLLGGCVKAIDVDSNGERLCVQFSGECSPYAAVFRLRSKPNTSLQPVGFIQSGDDSDVEILTFGGRLSQNEASLVTVAWSNGALRFIPFLVTLDSTALLRNGPGLSSISLNGSRLNATELYSA